MSYFKISYVLSLVISFLSCEQKNYHYPKCRAIADENGILKDSFGFYFSNFEPFDSSQDKFVRDTFWQQYLSANLWAFKEPVLYNNYLGKDRYRFLWLRSFHLPVVFNIANVNGSITLSVKKLARRPYWKDYCCIDTTSKEISFFREKGYQLFQRIDTLENGVTEVVTVVKGDRQSEIIYDSTKSITKKDWQNFEKLIGDAGFWSLKTYEPPFATDGSFWIIEANLKKQYKYVIRQSPAGKIRSIGEALIKLSGLKEEIY